MKNNKEYIKNTEYKFNIGQNKVSEIKKKFQFEDQIIKNFNNQNFVEKLDNTTLEIHKKEIENDLEKFKNKNNFQRVISKDKFQNLLNFFEYKGKIIYENLDKKIENYNSEKIDENFNNTFEKEKIEDSIEEIHNIEFEKFEMANDERIVESNDDLSDGDFCMNYYNENFEIVKKRILDSYELKFFCGDSKEKISDNINMSIKENSEDIPERTIEEFLNGDENDSDSNVFEYTDIVRMIDLFSAVVFELKKNIELQNLSNNNLIFNSKCDDCEAQNKSSTSEDSRKELDIYDNFKNEINNFKSSIEKSNLSFNEKISNNKELNNELELENIMCPLNEQILNDKNINKVCEIKNPTISSLDLKPKTNKSFTNKKIRKKISELKRNNFYESLKQFYKKTKNKINKICIGNEKQNFINEGVLNDRSKILLRKEFYNETIINILNYIKRENAHVKDIFRVNGDNKRVDEFIKEIDNNAFCFEEYVVNSCKISKLKFEDEKEFINNFKGTQFTEIDFKSCSSLDLANVVTRLIKLELNNLFDCQKIKTLFKYAQKHKFDDKKMGFNEKYEWIEEYLYDLTAEHTEIINAIFDTFLKIERCSKTEIKNLILSILGLFLPDRFINEAEKVGFLDYFNKKKANSEVVQRKINFVLNIVVLLANDHISE